MINESEIPQLKSQLATHWNNLELGKLPHPRNFALWLMDYDLGAIKNAFKVAAAWLNKQKTDPTSERVTAYVATCLRNSKLLNLTPDERAEQISNVRRLAGHLGNLRKHKKEFATACEDLREFATPCENLRALASGVEVDGDRGVDIHFGTKAAAPLGCERITSSEPLKPKTKNQQTQKSCPRCSAVLKRDENHSLVCPALNPHDDDCLCALCIDATVPLPPPTVVKL